MTGSHPLHSCSTPEYYTPRPYIEAARYVLGRIDLDPASSARANATVEADTYYTREDNGLSRTWFGHVYINPPGDRRGYLVKAFWRRACHHALYGGPDAAVLWAGYSLGPLPRLHTCEPFEDGTPCPGPIHWPIVVIGPDGPCTTTGGRICWIDGETGEPATQPGHGNYFCLLGGDRYMRARFRHTFGAFGSYQSPTRQPRIARFRHAFGAFGSYQSPTRQPRIARDLKAEIMAAMNDGLPHTGSEIALLIRARKQSVLHAFKALVQAGRITSVHGTRAWVLASAPTIPATEEPRESQETNR